MTNKVIISALIALLTLTSAYSQSKSNLSGYVRDAQTGEELIGVNLYFPDLKIGTTTNVYGYFSVEVPTGTHKLSIQYVSYQSFNDLVTVTRDLVRNFELKPSSEQLDAVEVTAEKLDANVSSVEMSVAKLSVKEVKKMPQLLGGSILFARSLFCQE